MISDMEYGKFITSALAEASEIALRYFGKVSGSLKEGDSSQVLTEADIKVGEYLVSRVSAAFPTHNVIGEEAGVIDKKSDHTWVIDPIDGTSNFAAGVPLYGIMIGLLKGGTPIAGGIALPSYVEVYVAEKSHGTFCNDKRIRVTSETNLSNVLVVYGLDGHREDPDRTHRECAALPSVVLAARNLRISNSVFDNMMVARGSYGAAAFLSGRIWDNVAPHVIIEEAGGVYTDVKGKSIDYSDATKRTKENFTSLAAPPALHAALLKIIAA